MVVPSIRREPTARIQAYLRFLPTDIRDAPDESVSSGKESRRRIRRRVQLRRYWQRLGDAQLS